MEGIVINPAAYTHTSVAILDAVKSVSIPTVEIHISKVEEREDFRQVSFIRQACIGTVTGLGADGYLRAIDRLEAHYAGRVPTQCGKGRSSRTAQQTQGTPDAHLRRSV